MTLLLICAKKSGLFDSLREVKKINITLFVYVCLFVLKRNAIFKIIKEIRGKYVKT